MASTISRLLYHVKDEISYILSGAVNTPIVMLRDSSWKLPVVREPVNQLN